MSRPVPADEVPATLSFQYSRGKVAAFTLPFVLIGTAMFLTSDDLLPKVGGVVGATAVGLGAVVCLRIQVRVNDGQLLVRYLRRWIPVRWKGVETQRVEHGMSSSRVLTMTDEDGRRRAMSLEFFSAAERNRLLQSLRHADRC